MRLLRARGSASRAEERRPSARPDRLLLVAIGLVGLVLWFRPLPSSLWLDETGTYWVIRDGLAEAVDRAARYQGQTPAYYVLEWGFKELAGTSEFALRLPSIAAAAGAAALLYRLSRRLFDRDAAVLSVLAFTGWGAVAFAAADARPYALALLALVASALLLVRWFEEPRIRWALAWGLLAAGTAYVHPLFALALPAQFIFAGRRTVLRTFPPLGQLVAGVGTLAVALLGLLPTLTSLWSRRAELNVPAEPSLTHHVFEVIAPPAIVAGVALGVLLARLHGPPKVSRSSGIPGALALVLPWALLPPVLLYLAALAFPTTLLSPRYMFSAAPGGAMIVGRGLAWLANSEQRRILALAFAIVSVLAYGGAVHGGEDWRGAADRVNTLVEDTATPVLVHPALVESGQLSWFRDPERRSYLLAPLSRYPMEGRIILLPYLLDEQAVRYLDEVVPSLISSEYFLLVTRYPFVPFRSWLDGRLGIRGWTSRRVASFGAIELIEFSRR